jgi:hypothetical protein
MADGSEWKPYVAKVLDYSINDMEATTPTKKDRHWICSFKCGELRYFVKYYPSADSAEKCRREYEVGTKLREILPHCRNFLGASHLVDCGVGSCLLVPWVDHKTLQDSAGLTDDAIIRGLINIVSVFVECEAAGFQFSHCDLHQKNIIVDSSNNFILIDFQLSWIRNRITGELVAGGSSCSRPSCLEIGALLLQVCTKISNKEMGKLVRKAGFLTITMNPWETIMDKLQDARIGLN